MIALSYSRMKDMQCPFRFNALHIERSYKEPETPAMRIGSAVHEILADYRRHCLDAGVPMDPVWIDAVLDNQHKAIPTDHDEREEILTLITGIRGTELLAVPIDALHPEIEQRLAFDRSLGTIRGRGAWFSSEVAFRCIADFSYIKDDTLFIVDDKTGWADPDPLQLGIYSYFVFRAMPEEADRPIRNIKTFFHDIRGRKIVLVSSIPVDDPDRLAVGGKVKQAIEEVNGWAEFPAVPCELCRFCSVPDCPRRDEASTAITTAPDSPVVQIPSEITDRQQAEQAVLFVSFAEGIIGRVKDLLRNYIQGDGPVTVGGRLAELRPNTPWKCNDVRSLLLALISYGVPKELIWRHVNINESALSKILKTAGLEDREQALLAAYGERRQHKARFHLGKAKPEF